MAQFQPPVQPPRGALLRPSQFSTVYMHVSQRMRQKIAELGDVADYLEMRARTVPPNHVVEAKRMRDLAASLKPLLDALTHAEGVAAGHAYSSEKVHGREQIS